MDPRKKLIVNFMPWQQLCFGYSALIDVKRNFEQTNPFECFFTLRGFTLIENRNKNCNSILPANMQFSESLHREVIFKHDS